MRHKRRRSCVAGAALFFAALFFPVAGSAEIKMTETDGYRLTAEPFVRTDVIVSENNVDLNWKIRDDRVQYIAFDYYAAFDLQIKNKGPEFYCKFERLGVYEYDTPVIINNTLETYSGKVKPYHNAELLPEINEFWADIPLSYQIPVNLKTGLFAYSVGHGLALGGAYNNYGVELYTQTDTFQWHGYYCWPDFNNKQLLGPYIKQQKPQGNDFEHSKAYYFATDMVFDVLDKVTIQPYVGALLDLSEGKRLNYFQTPTRQDLFGTVGVSGDFTFDKLKIGLEVARNWGSAQASQENFEAVIHQGYGLYAEGSYAFGSFVPHSKFVFATGNKLTTDMIANGDTTYPGNKNNAFSTYSPMNAFLADSIYSECKTCPLVAMGNGFGINYGVPRPTTFLDPRVTENLMLASMGFDYNMGDKTSFVFDWWYLASAQKGIGMYNGVPKVLSPELGNEFDLRINHKVTKNITFLFQGGIFLPGAAYREERTDTAGSLFTPFVRGDGKADPAYQAEASIELTF